MGLLVSIDNGGTLTDVCAFDGSRVYHTKTLTTPHDLTECLMEGLKSLSQILYDEEDLLRLITSIDHLRYSTTQGTNAIVQRKGPRLGLITDDEGLAGELRSGAPELYDQLVGSRLGLIAGLNNQAVVRLVTDMVASGASRLAVVLSGQAASAHEAALRRLLYQSFPRHLLGAVPMQFSTELTLHGGQVRRGWSTLINAFLHPSMEQFLYNAEHKLRNYRSRNPLLVFRNDGNSTRVAKTVALKTYSSGPRGGVEGARVLARLYGISQAVSIDIGGTTTDLAVFRDGKVGEHVFGMVESAPIAFPLTDVASVGAGGSSILSVEKGRVCVGPESVGSAPGPACFARGGTNATITDALLVAGLLDPDSFFSGRLRLDRERAERAILEHIGKPLKLDLDAAIERIINDYNAKIAASISRMTNKGDKGWLIAFGGAGPMSACGIAEQAGFDTILIPRYAAVFSAFGIGFSDIQHAYAVRLAELSGPNIEAAQSTLLDQARRGMQSEGFALEDCTQKFTVLIEHGDEIRRAAIGGALPVVAKGDSLTLELEVVRPIDQPKLSDGPIDRHGSPKPESKRNAFGGLPVFRMEDFTAGDCVIGPCLIEEAYFTAWVRPSWHVTVTGNHDLVLERQEARKS